MGWNFCYVGGSTLLSDQLSYTERAKTQGANELLLGLATATAGLGSGLVFAVTSFTAIGMLGAALALVPLGLTGWWMVRIREVCVQFLALGTVPRRASDRMTECQVQFRCRNAAATVPAQLPISDTIRDS